MASLTAAARKVLELSRLTDGEILDRLRIDKSSLDSHIQRSYRAMRDRGRAPTRYSARVIRRCRMPASRNASPSAA